MIPRALLQVHYHDRPGGVRRVMDAYSSAFSDFAGKSAPNHWICCMSGTWDYPHGSCIDLKDADYQAYRSVSSYRLSVDRLTRRLSNLLDSFLPFRPVAVVGHNLNLGKNPALSAAFSNCAKTLGGGGSFRFFSVLHDFAEQGRVDLLHVLRLLDRKFLAAERFAAGAPVHFIVPSECTAELTGLGKSRITVLPHPVETAPVSNGCTFVKHVRSELRRVSSSDGLVFDTERPLHCYPSRIVYRKNVFEALLVATVLMDGSLVVGASGGSRADRGRMKSLVSLARKHCLSLCVDPLRMDPGIYAGERFRMNPFPTICSCADLVLSTSLSEGFGFTLFEPWCYGKTVFGRRPEGYSLLRGMKEPGFYRRLPVPLSWVDVDELHLHFSRAYAHAYGKRFIPRKTFIDMYVRDLTIDFGFLREDMQIGIIGRVIGNRGDRAALSSLLRGELSGCKYASGEGVVARNREAVMNWSRGSFKKLFVKCISRRPEVADPAEWYLGLADRCRSPGTFRPLTSNF